MKSFVRSAWETDFCPVANDLLNRIEAHQSRFEALTPPKNWNKRNICSKIFNDKELHPVINIANPVCLTDFTRASSKINGGWNVIETIWLAKTSKIGKKHRIGNIDYSSLLFNATMFRPHRLDEIENKQNLGERIARC